jgi:hypothetical protein
VSHVLVEYKEVQLNRGDFGVHEENSFATQIDPMGGGWDLYHPGMEYRRRLSESGLLQPAGFGALLYKTNNGVAKEYAVAFQGVEIDEPVMLQFANDKAAIYFGTDVDGDGTVENVLTTQGLARYSEMIFPCIAKLSDDVADAISHVTGHSLGGSAATLYSLLMDTSAVLGSPKLVTFGAMPTLPIYTSEAVFYDWNGVSSDPSAVPTRGTISGTRYFHKFDPATSFWMNFGLMEHELDTPFMLYDMEKTGCATYTKDMDTLEYVVSPEYSGDSTDGLSAAEKLAVEDDLYSFLCTNYGVETNSVATSVDYNGYLAMLQPVPCVEALAGQAYAYAASVPGVSGMTATNWVWMPNEDFLQCSLSWVATVAAYSETYFTSYLHEENPAWTDSDNWLGDMMYTVSFYAWFGIFWIHSTYPNYMMDGAYGSDDYDYSTPLGYDSDTGRSADPLFELTNALATNLPQLVDSDGLPVDDIEGVLEEWLGFEFTDDNSGGDTGGGEDGGAPPLVDFGATQVGGEIKWQELLGKAKQSFAESGEMLHEDSKKFQFVLGDMYEKVTSMEEQFAYKEPDCEYLRSKEYSKQPWFTLYLAPKCYKENFSQEGECRNFLKKYEDKAMMGMASYFDIRKLMDFHCVKAMEW